MPTTYSDSCLALSDRPWRLTISDNLPLVNSGVKLYPILFEQVVMATCHRSKTGTEHFILLEGNGNLSFVRLDGVGYRFRSMSVPEVCPDFKCNMYAVKSCQYDGSNLL